MRFINWKKGVGGEALTFAIVAPLITFLICAVVSIAQVTLCNQKLMFAAYATARAAVVSDTQALAQDRAQGALEQFYPGAQVSFAYAGNTPSSSAINSRTGKGASCTIQYLSAPVDSSHSNWEKGRYIRCTVYQYLAVAMPFTSGVRGQSVAMMIENSKKSDLNIDLSNMY